MSSSYDDSNGNIVILTNIPGMVLKKNWLQLTLNLCLKLNKIKSSEILIGREILRRLDT